MEGNEMSVAFENRVFNRRSGLGGGRMGCTLITGFLGSGKTTLLKHLLDHRGDLRLAVLVNEFADSDVDSLLLDSARLNRAFNLSTVSLTHGCACCEVSGPFRESLQRIVDSKHNFDCLLIETSGLARPDKFVAELKEVGIHLDLVVAVVDAESLDKIIKIDIVRKQLEHVDIVLLNKCDLATLSQISNAEDILEELTAGAKVVRSQFCKVPVDLIIDCSKLQALNIEKNNESMPGVLSHESLPKMAFQRYIYDNSSLQFSSSGHTSNQPSVGGDRSSTDDLQPGFPHGESFSSATFEAEVPLSLVVFQSKILKSMRCASNLIRAKGIIWFAEDRESRFVFQWSGLKRVEAISGQPWESSPKSCIVLIGTDKSELQTIISQLSASANPHNEVSSEYGNLREHAKRLASMVASDDRFKEPSLSKTPLVIFGLKGSPLRGVKESQLNGALMHVVNGKGNIFLTATTFGEDYNLQILLDEKSTVNEAWSEIRSATSIVVSKLCKNFCPCRSDLTAHVH
ncbi:CobW/HypB/UreG, nucleotide-binding domain [Musa troglodytarum]|uniref:CobW/HypB/UreG, nucleotide-binding domain n=1 Tax=Musa troglodytarum TaxID=320322 RepID=A0A9E7IAG6_9LILI|nr:CobW/HypB/UreG, nucleotide-binding domain [Musa troglodytarum]URE43801.1 CobW/HypB/UreG, nucleotide-binding domain [Musa troglodytarum]URE43802.1 CobW/HypB/UreG, nucleotide-binding domain [Musa troglodytarum]URE43803.1 CobW/HypB/UreG, nucleotide-binding domain [Musa troglodytarum]URE43804.1 CobW/HypB/UreG, nucleotide-binding domain [Musa troglodytarum]